MFVIIKILIQIELNWTDPLFDAIPGVLVSQVANIYWYNGFVFISERDVLLETFCYDE